MDVENIVQWYRLQGHHVIHTASSYWFDAAPLVYQAFPFGWLIKPSDSELRALMLKHGIISIRYSTPLEASVGKVSYHVILRNPYNLDLLRSQARNSVRRGLTNCQVECIPFERLATEGWYLQRDTLDRHGRSDNMSEVDWRRICLSAVGLEGFEAWAAIVNGELAASLITVRIGDTWYVPYALSHRKFLNLYVNNALFYSFSCNILAREGVKCIFFNVESLDAPKSIDEFKFRMGLKAQVVRQRVVFNPLLAPFITNSANRLVVGLKKRYPEQSSLAKVEGIIQFFLQGKLPLDQQEWPECVAELKPQLIVDVEELSVTPAMPKMVDSLSSQGEDNGKF